MLQSEPPPARCAPRTFRYNGPAMSKKNAKPAGSEPAEAFEDRLAELEEIVRLLETGDKPLDESLALYERGVKALKQCHGILNKAEKRLKELVTGPDGKPVLKDLDAGDDEDPDPEDAGEDDAEDDADPPADQGRGRRGGDRAGRRKEDAKPKEDGGRLFGGV